MQKTTVLLKTEKTKFNKNPRYVHLRSEGLSKRKNAATKYFKKYLEQKEQ